MFILIKPSFYNQKSARLLFWNLMKIARLINRIW